MKTISAPELFNTKELSPFNYLKKANAFLSNPIQEKYGRELIIRALAEKRRFSSCEQLLRDLVRKSGLFPYLNSEFSEHTLEENFILDVYKTNIDTDFIFHAAQFKIYNLLTQGHNVVLSAPTSMGKSAIVDSLIASEKFQKIVLVVPTIALIDETRRRIAKRFAKTYQIIHHNTQEQHKENSIYILTQERVNERTDIENVDIFIIDEFYKLAVRNDDEERVTSLNIALSKLISNSKQFYMIGPNIDEIRGLSNISKGYYFIPSEFNTVALNVFEYNIAPDSTEEKNAQLLEILNEHDGQTIIYCKSPKSAGKVAKALLKILPKSDISTDYSDWVDENYDPDWDYASSLKQGIGIHHGALPRAIQQRTVDLFNTQKLKVLICTSTIIEGVNTVAKNVIIYDNRNGNNKIDRFTHNNIKGRAGRMNVHFIGNVFCLERIPKEEIETRVVDIPLGLQDTSTPLNLLAGVQNEHVTEGSKERLDQHMNSSLLSREFIKKHCNINSLDLEIAYKAINSLSTSELRTMCFKRNVEQKAMYVIIDILCLLYSKSLRRIGLSTDKQMLSGLLYSYILADTHQKYMRKQLEWIKKNHQSRESRSEAIDKELKIVRSLYGYTLPKVLFLTQDLVNLVAKSKKIDEEADYSAIASTFENRHLPANFSAIEEMGVPIQTLEKLVTDKLSNCSLDTLARFIRIYFRNSNKLTDIEKTFIRNSLV